MKKLSLTLICLCFGAFSCTEINNVILPGDKPVIEAFLAPNQKVSMKVFTEIPYSFEDEAGVSTNIEGLKILIGDDHGLSFTLKDMGNGLYESEETLGEVGTSYSMIFEYNGRTISASTILPPKPEAFEISTATIERIERDLSGGFIGGGGFGPGQGGGGFQQEDQAELIMTWSNTEGVYYFVAAQYAEENLDPVVQFPENENGFIRPQRRFNNEPVQTSTSTMRPQQFEYFGRYNIILYRLNPDYAALYENNNTSTQNISTPLSIISNGLGIFTGVNADTLTLTVGRLQ